MTETFDEYHQRQILDIPTNGINTTPGAPANEYLKIFNKILFDYAGNIEDQLTIKDIGQAHDGQLDDIGEDLNILRLGKDDEVYRTEIILHYLARTASGTLNDLINITSQAFRIPKSNVTIKSDYNAANPPGKDNEPKTVSISGLPLDTVENSTMAVEKAYQTMTTTDTKAQTKQAEYNAALVNTEKAFADKQAQLAKQAPATSEQPAPLDVPEKTATTEGDAN